MEDIKKINEQVKIMLLKYPELRSPFMRKQSHIKYWQLYDGLGKFGIPFEQYVRLTSAESVSRAIRKVLEENPELRPSQKIQEKTAELQEQHRLEFLKS